MKEVIFNKRLKELRMEKEMKQKELATLLSVHFYNISDWENGKSEPNFQILYKIATVFDVSVGYLLGVED